MQCKALVPNNVDMSQSKLLPEKLEVGWHVQFGGARDFFSSKHTCARRAESMMSSMWSLRISPVQDRTTGTSMSYIGLHEQVFILVVY